MKNGVIDILMITYNRPYYTRLALDRLLSACGDDESLRVWIWHNGCHAETLNLVKEYLEHPRVYRFHHSPENRKLNEPTNWLWENGDGEFVTKVDDDCLLEDGWTEKLRAAHQVKEDIGVIACWRFHEEDYEPQLARKKILDLAGGHKWMLSLYTQGSGYVMKRKCIQEEGLLRPEDSFQSYCFRLAEKGWMHGWYFPFIFEDHMDDPRSEYTLLKTEEDYKRLKPLSSNSRPTIEDWLHGIRMNAWRAQAHNPDIRWHKGWRKAIHGVANRVRWKLGVRKIW